MYVGLNDSSAAGELAAIRKGKPGIQAVTDAGPSNARARTDDSYFVTKLGVKGHWANLATKKGRADFVQSLDVPPATAKKIEAVLARAPKGMRDELAQMAVGWAAAERGGVSPSRLVLSGHSDGDKIWGEKSDEDFLTPKLLGDLAKAMPKAAAQVEDLALSACSCGGRETIEQWKDAFPNLKTMLAYRTSSPDITQGSSTELARWEKLTRGPVTTLDPKYFNPTAATWTVKNGYMTKNSIDVAKVRETLDKLRPGYLEIKNGDRPLDAAAKELLQEYRTALRELGSADNSEVTRDQRISAVDEAQSVLLLQHYDEWKPVYAKTYAPELKAAYKQLNLAPPSKGFDKMSRAEALAEVDRMVKAIHKAGDPKSLDRALEVLRGLRSLDPVVAHTNWID